MVNVGGKPVQRRRAVAIGQLVCQPATRGRSLLVNLPGKLSAGRECLEIVAPAIREGVAHLRGEDPPTPTVQPPHNP